MREIVDRQSLEHWLGSKPREVSVAIATRAALRTYPLLMRHIGSSYGADAAALAASRALLTAVVATKLDTAPTREAASAARRAGNLATSEGAPTLIFKHQDPGTTQAADAATLVARAVFGNAVPALAAKAVEESALANSASSRGGFSSGFSNGLSGRTGAPADIYSIVALDAERADQPSVGAFGIFRYPLWPVGPPSAARQSWNQFIDASSDGGPWQFWRRWYEALLRGQPLRWDLQQHIALLSDDDWGRGVEAVASQIRQIEARLLKEASELAEVVWFDEQTTKFDVRPNPVERADILRLAVRRVEDAFADTIALGRGQGVREEGLEALILRRVFDKYRHDPQRVEMDFVDVAGIVARQIKVGEYPDSQDLQALVRALTIAASEICATHPEVAETRTRLDSQAEIETLNETDQELLATALPVLRAITSDRLGAGLAEDTPELMNDALLPPSGGAPRLPPAGPRPSRPRKSVVRRLAFRIASISALLGGVVKAVAASTGYEAVQIIGTVSQLVTMLLSWL